MKTKFQRCIKLNSPHGEIKSKGLILGKTFTIRKCHRTEKGREKSKVRCFNVKERRKG